MVRVLSILSLILILSNSCQSEKQTEKQIVEVRLSLFQQMAICKEVAGALSSRYCKLLSAGKKDSAQIVEDILVSTISLNNRLADSLSTKMSVDPDMYLKREYFNCKNDAKQ